MKKYTSLVALALFTMALAGCSKHSPDAAAQNSDTVDFASLTNSMKIKTSEPIISVEKIDSKFTRFIVITGSASQSHHYVATWIRSQWSINPLVK